MSSKENKESNMSNPYTTKTKIRQYDPQDLPRLGWVTITEHGEENTYFTLADGSVGFVKTCS